MELLFAPFQEYLEKRIPFEESHNPGETEILTMDIFENEIFSLVSNNGIYDVNIKFSPEKVTSAVCTCSKKNSDSCSHIREVMLQSDASVATGKIEENTPEYQEDLFGNKIFDDSYIIKKNEYWILKNQNPLEISDKYLEKNSIPIFLRYQMPITIREMQQDYLHAEVEENFDDPESIVVEQVDSNLVVSCTCQNHTRKLCIHSAAVLKAIKDYRFLYFIFQKDGFINKFREKAKKMGMHKLSDEELKELFKIEYDSGRIFVQSKNNLISFSKRQEIELVENMLPQFEFPETFIDKETFVLCETNNYTEDIKFSLKQAPLSKKGTIKAPIDDAPVSKIFSQARDADQLLFYGSLMDRDYYEFSEKDDYQHRNILKNPLDLNFYHFENEGYYKPTPRNLTLLNVHQEKPKIKIVVKQKKSLYHLKSSIYLNGKKYSPAKLILRDSFLLLKDQLFFIEDYASREVIRFFQENDNKITLHDSSFENFKSKLLDKLENSVEIEYSFIKKAPAKILKEKKLDRISEELIYLTESENWILITPVVRYADLEVPILSKKTLYTDMPDGKRYAIKRDDENELKFLRNVQKQHPDFEELPVSDFFYLHKQKFLDEGWFLDAFEEWRKQKYQILGFKQLKNNNLNPNKMKVSISVNSGIDWFDVHTKVNFGDQEVRLTDLQKSVLNKKRFVKLNDGSEGILPEEWLEKFSRYFRSGEIKGEVIRTHKSNFQLIDELFEKEVLSKETKLELKQFNKKIKDFSKIKNVKIPEKLKAELRPYQKEGLNWLNFLEEFGFGGILADDMGLGKTVQIIAYILSQQEKGKTDSNLIVVPTSLLFNWQRELDKFAPHLDYKLLYGTDRNVREFDFENTDIVLTTYGTMLSDIEVLKEQVFQLVVLDESQAIKNPNSKRYKAVRLLQAKQRLALTGTPVENNTFDLFAQLSFVMPGLLGSQKRFKDDYSTPIDKFQDESRARELQKKVHPFILRRTKKQVATELPEKTTMTVYCEMNPAQRKIYDAYKMEFQEYLQGKSDEELRTSKLHILQGLTKLRQICNSPALLSDQEYYGEQSAKLDELMVQINKLKDDHKVLVFSQFVGMLELIREKLDQEKIKYSYLTGKTRKREKEVEEFQNDEEKRVFLISLKAGGTGLNLTQAEYVFIIDPWWNPAAENQAIDRAYRIGQKNHVIAVRLITPDTIEEKIMELQEKKLQLVEDLIHTDKNTFKNLSKNDLLDLV